VYVLPRRRVEVDGRLIDVDDVGRVVPKVLSPEVGCERFRVVLQLFGSELGLRRTTVCVAVADREKVAEVAEGGGAASRVRSQVLFEPRWLVGLDLLYQVHDGHAIISRSHRFHERQQLFGERRDRRAPRTTDVVCSTGCLLEKRGPFLPPISQRALGYCRRASLVDHITDAQLLDHSVARSWRATSHHPNEKCPLIARSHQNEYFLS